MATITLVLTFLAFIAQCLAGNDGDWTTTTTDTWWTPSPTTTVWWTPTTTSYWSTWTPTSTYTSEYTQQNVIVTVTSTLPCPATSTVVTWVCCDQCETNCQNTPTSTTTTNWGGVGTVTVTSHTTITPTTTTTTSSSQSVVYATTTSGSLVIVYASTATVATAASDTTATPSLVYAVSSDAQDGTNLSLSSFAMVLAMVATVMILL
ncbi:hypothetical protein EDD36DRAFT_461461 [Exophiala viscosa]|uniref:Uncharacterized protein n=1 Tax=Exophiala viscosa TaxID=2486360 RepID=A0AAN6IIK5_9EURO|nr:hypothetical protein EDD36DRAFT_461461 [Exophiala viscosa]